MNYDAIIVGGGPAGTAAGLALSKFNLSVCLIDKCFFPRSKVCAGIITEKTIRILKKILPEFDFCNYYKQNQLIFAKQCGMRVPYKISSHIS